MFNIRKNYQRNKLIIPNENYFIERAEKTGDEKVKKMGHRNMCGERSIF